MHYHLHLISVSELLSCFGPITFIEVFILSLESQNGSNIIYKRIEKEGGRESQAGIDLVRK